MKKTLCLLAALLAASALFAQQKYALVIGNSNYSGISSLRNPANDANDMETALKALGFNVEKLLNGDLERMEDAVENLGRRLGASADSIGFFFYAGHGAQSGGVNYLIPVSADNIRNETHLRQRAVSLDFVLKTLGDARNSLNMIVLDACRDNPFAWNRSGSRGLTVVESPPAGSIVMFAAGAGQVADDGGAGRNGLFTGHLLANLKTPGLSVRDVFDRTMGEVLRATGNRQTPELRSLFPASGTVFLGSRPSPGPQPSPQPAPQPNPAPDGMVRVPGGTFRMGSPSGGSNVERPVRNVTVSSFLMSIYPVTQKEWRDVTGSNAPNFKGDDFPVTDVNWFEAVEYANRRSQSEGLTPAYTINGTSVSWNRSANGYRLPTEAEWEYAARGGNGSPGNFTYSGSDNIDDVAWYEDNSGNGTQPVGKKRPNALGIYDMSGNVWEWCWDWFGTYPNTAQTDPSGASSGSSRVLRGGCWYFSAGNVHSAYRFSLDPSVRLSSSGFRLVRPSLTADR